MEREEMGREEREAAEKASAPRRDRESCFASGEKMGGGDWRMGRREEGVTVGTVL